MGDYAPPIDVPDEVVDLMAAAVKVTVRNIPGHVSDRMADQIARSALHAMTPWLAAHDATVRADHEKAVRERIVRDITRELGDGRAADIVREGA